LREKKARAKLTAEAPVTFPDRAENLSKIMADGRCGDAIEAFHRGDQV
jgi:hypothetical protein